MSDERFVQISGSFNGYIFCAHTHSVSIQPNKQGYKVCFGRKKMEACRRESLRKTTVVSRTPHTLISVHLQTYLQGKICLFQVKFPWNLFPAWAEAAKYTKRNCNNRRMLCEIGEPLFVIIRLTLRPFIDDISDKSQTLKGVTLEQETPYLICIWTLQGSLVD